MNRAAALAAGALLCVAVAADSLGWRAPAPLRDLPQSRLQVVTDSGRHRFKVWIAADDASRDRGLMFVQELPRRHGLLFLFDSPRITAFWMKDTYLALDLIFIAEDGRVVNIIAGAKPLSLEPLWSAGPVKGALEVPAGTAARIGLRPGDRVRHAVFTAAAPQE